MLEILFTKREKKAGEGILERGFTRAFVRQKQLYLD
jgi:hypothetical protein